jgi:hypothetical protein
MFENLKNNSRSKLGSKWHLLTYVYNEKDGMYNKKLGFSATKSDESARSHSCNY